MNAIEVRGLNKSFGGFSLQDMNITLPTGYIMGVIGANGAGKTTLIRILLGLYHRDNGDVKVLGMDPYKEGHIAREDIGVVFDEPRFYDFRLGKIKRILSPFYKNWDDAVFSAYMTKFSLDESMRFRVMSRGMRLKFALAMALSHHARLLILDEPTSGLDPVFRIELLDILQGLVENGEISVLFSSHITSDIEKVADYITYVQDGKVVFSDDRNSILDGYMIVKGGSSVIPDEVSLHMIGGKTTDYHYEALLPRSAGVKKVWSAESRPTLEELMYYFERGCNQ